MIKTLHTVDGTKGEALYALERELWWASLGENVGSEIHDKNDLASHPVVIRFLR